MTAITGIVTGREIVPNKDGEAATMMLQVQITDPDDIQQIQLMRQAGEDTNPPDGSTVVIFDAGDAWRVAVASDDGIVPTVSAGEKKLYSVSGGAIAAALYLISTGVVEINGGGNSAVAFADLKTGFDQLKSDFNTHTHASVTSLGTPTVPVPQTTASIDSAESSTVTLP